MAGGRQGLLPSRRTYMYIYIVCTTQTRPTMLATPLVPATILNIFAALGVGGYVIAHNRRARKLRRHVSAPLTALATTTNKRKENAASTGATGPTAAYAAADTAAFAASTSPGPDASSASTPPPREDAATQKTGRPPAPVTIPGRWGVVLKPAYVSLGAPAPPPTKGRRASAVTIRAP